MAMVKKPGPSSPLIMTESTARISRKFYLHITRIKTGSYTSAGRTWNDLESQVACARWRIGGVASEDFLDCRLESIKVRSNQADVR